MRNSWMRIWRRLTHVREAPPLPRSHVATPSLTPLRSVSEQPAPSRSVDSPSLATRYVKPVSRHARETSIVSLATFARVPSSRWRTGTARVPVTSFDNDVHGTGDGPAPLPPRSTGSRPPQPNDVRSVSTNPPSLRPRMSLIQYAASWRMPYFGLSTTEFVRKVTRAGSVTSRCFEL